MIRERETLPDWAMATRTLGDDLSSSDAVLLGELAQMIARWPASNPVAIGALEEAARRLAQLAAEAED